MTGRRWSFSPAARKVNKIALVPRVTPWRNDEFAARPGVRCRGKEWFIERVRELELNKVRLPLLWASYELGGGTKVGEIHRLPPSCSWITRRTLTKRRPSQDDKENRKRIRDIADMLPK